MPWESTRKCIAYEFVAKLRLLRYGRRWALDDWTGVADNVRKELKFFVSTPLWTHFLRGMTLPHGIRDHRNKRRAFVICWTFRSVTLISEAKDTTFAKFKCLNIDTVRAEPYNKNLNSDQTFTVQFNANRVNTQIAHKHII